MKCRLIRDMEGPNPEYDFAKAQKLGRRYDVPPNLPLPIGTVLDEPDAFRLVRMGCAEPADEECAKAAGMSPEAFEAAKLAYDKMEKGMATGNPQFDADPPAEEDEDEEDIFDDE